MIQVILTTADFILLYIYLSFVPLLIYLQVVNEYLPVIPPVIPPVIMSMKRSNNIIKHSNEIDFLPTTKLKYNIK